MPLTSTYLKQMKLRVMNSQEQVSRAGGVGQVPAPTEGMRDDQCSVLGTSISGGCFWKWPVGAGGSSSGQAQRVLACGSREGSVSLVFWLVRANRAVQSPAAERSRHRAGAVIACSSLLVL